MSLFLCLLIREDSCGDGVQEPAGIGEGGHGPTKDLGTPKIDAVIRSLYLAYICDENVREGDGE